MLRTQIWAAFIPFPKSKTRFNTHNQHAFANAFLELLRLSSISQYHECESYVGRSEIYSASQKKPQTRETKGRCDQVPGVWL